MRAILLALTLFTPSLACAVCDWSLPQPQADCYGATPPPPLSTTQGPSGAPNPGATSPAPPISSHNGAPYPYAYSCSAKLELAISDRDYCLDVLGTFNEALATCQKQLAKKRRR